MSSNHPFASGSSGAGAPAGFSSAQLTMDNLIRRELRVGDPNDPIQIAQALRNRYHDQPRTRAIDQEARGLPFLQASPVLHAPSTERTATSHDLAQAQRDVERDLEELTTNSLLKDVMPELQGWADSIRSSMGDGIDAARFGLDPRNRDRALGIRRTLGDYARLARLVGALTPSVGRNYRSLAQSIDEVCSVILVLIGESIANAGFAGGRFMLQAPYSELQTRRDAVMHSLRNLLGALQYSGGQDEWPRGIDAYRRLFDALEAQGQGDLRALMTEQELSRVMDQLVRRAAQGGPDGLRAIGSTAAIDLQRFHRLVNFGYQLVDPESPPLTSFLEALRLFADGFNESGGFRLLRIARPPILFYGLYGSEQELPSDRRLIQLTVWRGRLAGLLDCLMRCDCSEATVRCQVLLDKILYDVDRAIDLYAVGQDDLGPPEIRAAAYSFMIDALRGGACVPAGTTLSTCLDVLGSLLRPGPSGTFTSPEWDTTRAQFDARRAANVLIDDTDFRFAALMYQEVCLQRQGEERWEALVRQLAPNCIGSASVFDPIRAMLDNAMFAIQFGVTADQNQPAFLERDCRVRGPDIPADIATSLDTLAYAHGRRGQGR